MIETERLILRRHRAADIDARAAIFADPDHLRFIGGPQTREECWIRIQRYVGHWTLKGYGLFAVEDRASGALIGEAGLATFKRGFGDTFDRWPEAAWVIAPGHGNKGLAGEAMTAAIAWHEAQRGPTPMVAVVSRDNQPSLRVADRLGFQPLAERHYRGAACVLLRRRSDLA